MLEVHGIKTTVLSFECGDFPDLTEIENQLKKDPTITGMAIVYHETSTGMINPVRQMGNLSKQYGKTFFVDAVSALGGEDVDVVRDHIDLCTSSSNKCLASYPGIGIICAKKSSLEATRHNKIKITYLNLHRLLEYSEKYHQTPNTPSVTLFIALDAAVKHIVNVGLQNQISRYRQCAKVIREGVKKMGLKMLIENEHASNTVTSVFLPEKVNLKVFIQKLEDKGYTVYSGKRHLKKQGMFQIANMGAITEEMCLRFLETMADAIKECGA